MTVRPTRLVLLADSHGYHAGLSVPEGDILVHAGDLTGRGRLHELEDTNRWLLSLPHPFKIAIAGNHDFCFEEEPEAARRVLTAAIYLQDEAVEVGGIRFWGSPWQPWFYDWAFNLKRGPALAHKWALIPDQVDVLVTHGPPAGILDKTFDGREVGCEDLLRRVEQVKPKLHVFGHIHEGRGALWRDGTLFVNASVSEGQEPAVALDWPPSPPILPR
jgi:Icc-related predicted phosphoesterase